MIQTVHSNQNPICFTSPNPNKISLPIYYITFKENNVIEITPSTELVLSSTNPTHPTKQYKSSFVSSSDKPGSDDGEEEEVEIDYDADDDDDDDHRVDDSDDYELNEIVIDSTGSSGPNHILTSKKQQKQRIATKKIISKNASQPSNPSNPSKPVTDSTSSSESGFGTVDDDIDPNNPNHLVNKLETRRNPSESVIIDMSGYGKKPSQSSESQYPILQPPKQVVYEFGVSAGGDGGSGGDRRRSDEIVNILSNSSSLNSSVCSESSESSDSKKNCCSRFIAALVRFYYSCFCCVSSSHDKPLLCCTWLSIFCCCCPLLAGVSLYLTKRSKRFKLKQKYELADKYSNWAEKLNIASLILGIIFYAIAFFMITLVIFMYWRPHNS